MKTENTVVWAEIPVTDLDSAMRFYEKVLGGPLRLDDKGPNPMAFLPGQDTGSNASGHLYRGKPAPRGTGSTVHLAVDDIENAMERVRQAGGEVVSPPIEIPGGRFAYCLDLDGNSIGLFAS